MLNFPTKRHWRQPSRMEDISAGLDDLVRVVGELKIKSVAVPPLGCGNGGLPWPEVRALIIDKLQKLDADVRLYGLGTPHPEDMPTATSAPELNQQRARFLAAVRRYIACAWAAGITEVPKASLLEFHKIAYLLQGAGINLGLEFEAGHYGPYSRRLDQAIAALEGHQVIGFGDAPAGRALTSACDPRPLRRPRRLWTGTVRSSRPGLNSARRSPAMNIPKVWSC